MQTDDDGNIVFEVFRRGKWVERKLNPIIDLRDYRDAPPGQAWLILAAARHLSITDTLDALDEFGIERTPSWVHRCRWMFQPLTKDITKDRDGQDNRAIRIMQEHPTYSSRGLVFILRSRGITRSREWIRKNRLREPV
jgi:hypothetical protein